MGIFNNDRIEDIVIGDFDFIFNSIKKLSFSSGIFSNVGNPIYTTNLLSFSSKLLAVNHQLKYPFEIKYSFFDSLGLDRIANVMGGYSLFPNKENLIIDIGTCIT